MILWEGPDRCGKTTAALAVRSLLPGWSYRHHTNPQKIGLQEAYPYHLWGIADGHARMSLDRLHWSDYAYGLTYRKGHSYTPHKWRMLELALLSRACIVAVMLDNPKNIIARWSADEMFEASKVPEIYRRYKELMMQDSQLVSKLPCTSFNLTDLFHDIPICEKPTDQFLAFLLNADDAASHALSTLPPSVGCGSLWPKFMVVGETPGDAFKGELAPGLPWDRGKAAEWLWRAFDEIGLWWWQGYYTNATAFTGPSGFAYYINNIVTPKVILCLGGRAYQLAKKAKYDLRGDLTVVAVDHPMYIRRFHHGKFDEWRDELKSALGNWCDAA